MANVYNLNGDGIFNQKYNGKKLSILGDSISTYKGYIPTNYDYQYYTWYDPTKSGGLSSVDKTWWKIVMDALGMTLEVNNSAGATDVTLPSVDSTKHAGCGHRAQELGTNPDVIIIFMGVNDFGMNRPMGSYDGSTGTPASTTDFREAYALMLHKIMTAYPSAEVWCSTIFNCEYGSGQGSAPSRNSGGVTLNAYNKAIKDMADLFGAGLIDNSKCGITYENMFTYLEGWNGATQTSAVHPNELGMKLIAANVIKSILPSYDA